MFICHLFIKSGLLLWSSTKAARRPTTIVESTEAARRPRPPRWIPVTICHATIVVSPSALDVLW